MILGVLFSASIVAVFAYGVYEVRQIPLLARIFPFWISLVALCLSLFQLGIELRRYFSGARELEADFADLIPDRDLAPSEVYRRAAYYFMWIAGLYVAVWLIGFVTAMGVFVFCFLVLEARQKWFTALPMSLLSSLFLVAISWLMTLYWPEGLISSWLDLPWPLT